MVTHINDHSSPLCLPPKPKKNGRKKKRSLPALFPSKLYNLIQNEVEDSTASTVLSVKVRSITNNDAPGSHEATKVAWLPHGQAFIIINEQRFTEEILPRYFQTKKFKSFQRQLYLWGFNR